MGRVFSDGSRIQKYLDIEAALARVQARLGIIPREAAEEICRHCTIDQFDFEKLKKQTERIGYPVLPVVQQLVALCKDGLGEWCHWGATTQDITDTATTADIHIVPTVLPIFPAPMMPIFMAPASLVDWPNASGASSPSPAIVRRHASM